MRKTGLFISFLLIMAFAVTCLGACGSGAGEASSSQSRGPVYLVKHQSWYIETRDDPYMTATNEYDEFGNMTKRTIETITDFSTNKKETTVLTYSEFDNDGYWAKSTNSKGDVITWENTIENGHATKRSNSDGATTEYAYYDDGKMKSLKTLIGDARTIIEYGENGLPESGSTEGTSAPEKSEYTWEFDDKGFIKGFTRTSDITGKTETSEYTAECDDDGNVILVYSNGKVSQKIEYQKIENPSTYAWVNSWHGCF